MGTRWYQHKSIKMWAQFILLLLMPVQNYGCNEKAIEIPYLYKRSRFYSPSTVDIVDDSFIALAWYNAFHEGSQYRMPDNTTIPSKSSCGGDRPIYLKDIHPNTELLGEIGISLATCTVAYGLSCGIQGTVKIRKCDGQIHYKLYSTYVSFTSYCFDSPETIGVKDFPVAPDVIISGVSVMPSLHFNEEGNPQTSLLCETSSQADSLVQLFVHTFWYVNSELKFHHIKIGEVTHLTETDLLTTGLGKNISCGIRLSSSPTGKLTALVVSDRLFAGIKVLNPKVYMLKQQQSATIVLERTIPFGCHTDSSACRLYVHTDFKTTCEAKGTLAGMVDKEVLKSSQHHCGVEFEGATQGGNDWTKINNRQEMTISTTDISIDDPNAFVLSLKVPDTVEHTVWKDYTLEEIEVIVSDNGNYIEKICHAWNDPHMQTSDGYNYEHQHLGEFIMYRNTEYPIEVQIKTKLCWPDGSPYCTCAVAIRAGGDVFLINMCDWPENRLIRMTSCQDNGILNIKNTDTDPEKYEVFTPIGTLIEVRYDRNWYGLINVNIRMAPKDLDNVEGLCGHFDGNSNTDDMLNRNKKPTNDRTRRNNYNYHDVFSKEWRIKSDEANYLRETSCNSNVESWAESNYTMYCVCEKCLETNNCDELKDVAQCSPSQYLDCPRAYSDKTKALCRDFIDRCDFHRRRRSVVLNNVALTSEISSIDSMKTKRETKTYTLSDAEILCSEAIGGHPALTYVPDAANGLNASHAILNCVFDVMEGQSDVWVRQYVHALTDIVGMNMERDPNYRETHTKEIATFKSLSCPLNCSGRGNCTTEGHCICSKGFNGSDCLVDITSALPIFGVVGNELCDYNGNCESFEIQTFDLVNGYTCKIKETQVLIDGRKVAKAIVIITGYFLDIFTARCALPIERKKRSSESNQTNTVLAYVYNVSISNDGNTFSEEVSFLVYDPSCQTTVNQTDGSFNVSLRGETCFIDGRCRQAHDTLVDDSCYKCLPSVDKFSWTNDCVDAKEDQETKGLPLYAIGIVSVVPVVIMIVVVVVACKCCKRNKPIPRAVSPILGPNKKVFDKQSLQQKSYLDASNISLHGL